MYRCNKVTEKHVILFVSTNSNIERYSFGTYKCEKLYCIVFIYYQIIQELQGLTMTMNKLIMNIW